MSDQKVDGWSCKPALIAGVEAAPGDGWSSLARSQRRIKMAFTELNLKKSTMRRLLMLLPLLLFSGPVTAQELNLKCGPRKFYMREGSPDGVTQDAADDRFKTNVM